MMIITKGLGYIFAASALISIVVFICAVSLCAEETRDGVHVLKFNLLEGRIEVYLPDDMAAGDTVSASIAVYPSGNSPEVKNNNSRVLNSYTVETSFNSVPVGTTSFKLNIPKNMAGGTMKFTLGDQTNSALGSLSAPVKLSSRARGGGEVPTPFDYQCPLVGQAGRLVQIKGPFDGDYATTDFQIGGKKARVLAESPRKLVFETPIDVAGSVDLVLKEREVVVKRPFTCLRIVKIGEEGAVPVSRFAEEPTSRESYAAKPAKSTDLGTGIREKELSGTMQRLEFKSIKAEETFTPVQQNETRNQIADAYSHTDRIGVILAGQMSAPFEGGAIIAERATVAETAVAATVEEKGTPAVYEEDIAELAYEVIAEPEQAEKEGPDTPELSSLPGEINKGPGQAERDLQAAIIERQLAASFTGAVSTGASVVLPPSELKGNFTVQVASFKTVEDAERLAGKLGDKGYPVFVVPADIPGRGRWYRVRVGAFPTRREAGVFSDYLKKKEPLVTSVLIAENE